MTRKKERQHKKPMTSKSNKRLADGTAKNSSSHSNAKALNAATRNPTTPAGTYPAFENHLGVSALEQKHELKQTKQHKRKTRKENISLFLKTVVPVFLVAGVLLGGIMLFANNTPRNSIDSQATVSAQVTATPQPTATPTPESTAKPTPTKTSTAFIQKWCSTTPTATPYRDSDGVMQHPAGSGRDAYYVPFNEDCGVRYTQAKSDKSASSSSLGDHPILLCLLLGSILALGGGVAYVFDKAMRSMEN
jgi:hypothetical protein